MLNDDALKHSGADDLNQTWVQLIQKLKVWEDMDNHLMYLRTRWVLGCSEWLAGMHGSKENDKEKLGYTDDEWTFIWSTMAEDGAWAVPPIKTTNGEIIRQNNAPELFIKYIAHDIQCHIIVIDLSLNRVQFCSANHLKDDNVKFDSPLLLYTTGGHFQAVHQKNHEFFVKFVDDLEAGQTSEAFVPDVSFECFLLDKHRGQGKTAFNLLC